MAQAGASWEPLSYFGSSGNLSRRLQESKRIGPAVDYVEADRVSIAKKRAAAEKITIAQRQAIALESEPH